MRWLAYFILAYIVLGVQLGIGAHARVGGATPNLVLLAALFVAINAPRDVALLGCFAMGLMQDMLTTQTLGLYALSYGLVGLLVTSSQQVVLRGHPVAHALLGLSGAALTNLILLVHGWVHPPGPSMVIDGHATSAMRVSFGVLFYGTIYTTMLAPVLLGVLQRIRGMFAFEPQRRSRVPMFAR
jgi:rod shape-determining protein MreD